MASPSKAGRPKRGRRATSPSRSSRASSSRRRDYVYWFELADGTRSPAGRFRTLPTGKTPDAVLAVVSCQLYPGGYFNAYASIAKLARLDAVVHLGDYIYEYGAEGYGAEIGGRIGRAVEPPHEIVTLADYRARHAHYKNRSHAAGRPCPRRLHLRVGRS